MTDDNEPENNSFDGVGGMGKLEQIRYSTTNNIKRWGNTENPVFGLLISLALALPGVALWYLSSGIPAALGVAWVIINLVGPAKWVMKR